MELSPQNLDYLTGRRHDPARGFAMVPTAQRAPQGAASRLEQRVLDLVSGLRVLHVGCADEAGALRERLAGNRLLFARLNRVASLCSGLDGREAGVQLLRDLGFAAYALNAAPAALRDTEFDVCLLAHALEFQPNPGEFLAGLLRYRFHRLMVAVPNGLRLANFWPGPEVVNTEHRLSLTPYTVCKLLVDAGFQPDRVEFCHGEARGWKGALRLRVQNLSPRWRDMLLVHAKPVG